MGSGLPQLPQGQPRSFPALVAPAEPPAAAGPPSWGQLAGGHGLVPLGRLLTAPLPLAGVVYSLETKRSILNQQYLAALRQIAVVFLTNWNTMAPSSPPLRPRVVPLVSLRFATFACNASCRRTHRRARALRVGGGSAEPERCGGCGGLGGTRGAAPALRPPLLGETELPGARPGGAGPGAPRGPCRCPTAPTLGAGARRRGGCWWQPLPRGEHPPLVQYAAPRLIPVCFVLLSLGRSLCWKDPPATPLHPPPYGSAGGRGLFLSFLAPCREGRFFFVWLLLLIM